MPSEDPAKTASTAPAPHNDAASLQEFTTLLQSAAGGNRQAAVDLLPVMYQELRRLAQSWMNRLPPGQTLSATALVHEAYARLVGESDPGWDGRPHFFGAAAQAMRNIIVEQARRKSTRKRGGDRARGELHPDALAEITAATPLTQIARDEEVLVVDAAIDRLAAEHPRPREVVMLHYFAGLTHAQIASLLNVTVRTVERDWRFAKAWLLEALSGAACELSDE